MRTVTLAPLAAIGGGAYATRSYDDVGGTKGGGGGPGMDSQTHTPWVTSRDRGHDGHGAIRIARAEADDDGATVGAVVRTTTSRGHVSDADVTAASQRAKDEGGALLTAGTRVLTTATTKTSGVVPSGVLETPLRMIQPIQLEDFPCTNRHSATSFSQQSSICSL